MDVAATARQIDGELLALTPASTPQARALRRRWTRSLRMSRGPDVLGVGIELLEHYHQRFLAYELIRYHPKALALVDSKVAEQLGAGMRSWGEVDMFATLIGGQAWRRRQIPDGVIMTWARLPNHWWRRAALVSTVPLNVKNQGGSGDAARTLTICELLLDDREDLVVKALSWALRELVSRDPAAVQAFLDRHDNRLATRVKREVTSKLRTGLKSPHAAT